MKKVLGIGNALVDIMISVESDAILDMLGLPKGSMQLVNMERSNAIIEALKNYKWSRSAGGSVANMIHGLAKLDAPAGYIGSIGEDEMGGHFVKDMINAGVEPHMIHSSSETGRVVALVTPDSERTFATFLGSSGELSAEMISSFNFRNYDYLMIEGYLVQNHDLVIKTAQKGKENGLIVAIDLASYNVVEANLDFLRTTIKKYIDIVFANEEEARAFTGKEPGEALKEIGTLCEIAVVKTGGKGSLIKRGKEIEKIGVIPVIPVDTTGAGDLYAAGFLYGLINDLPIRKCGELGALLAGNVIEFMGSKMSNDRWQKIRDDISSISG